MNKQEAITKISEIRNCTKVEAEKNLDAVLELIEYCVENKDPLKMVGHFTMEVKERASRVGKNPKTKEEIQIPATNVVKFKIGSKLKQLAKQ